jgi:enterochelin esterase-like enzyme
MLAITRFQVWIFLILVLLLAGCQFQPGYYLTPEHFPVTPTPPPSETPIPSLTSSPSPIPATLTWTPDSPSPSPTLTPVPCDDLEGQIVQDSFWSQVTGRDFFYRVYLPPCYAVSQRRYPYLIMLHGLGDGMDDSQWDRMGLDEAADIGYAHGSLPPLIIVMPNGNDLHGYNPTSYEDSYERLIVEELMPVIETNFCTWNEPEARAIGGLSRGGFWAFEIALRNPDLFSRVGGHSPAFFDEGPAPAFNPYYLVDEAEIPEGLHIYLDHGAGDWTVTNVRYFSDRLDDRGIAHTYVVNPVGEHTEAYWASHTADYLAFYTEGWPIDIAQLPSCQEPSPPPGE